MPSMTAVLIRRATAEDLPAIVALLADDPLGAARESPDDLVPYQSAFAAVDADPRQLLIVAERAEEVVATLQLTVIPGLSRQGATLVPRLRSERAAPSGQLWLR
jgi:hypothetical protein